MSHFLVTVQNFGHHLVTLFLSCVRAARRVRELKRRWGMLSKLSKNDLRNGTPIGATVRRRSLRPADSLVIHDRRIETFNTKTRNLWWRYPGTGESVATTMDCTKFNERPGHIRSEKGKDSASRQHNPEKAKLSNLSRHSGMPQWSNDLMPDFRLEFALYQLVVFPGVIDSLSGDIPYPSLSWNSHWYKVGPQQT